LVLSDEDIDLIGENEVYLNFVRAIATGFDMQNFKTGCLLKRRLRRLLKMRLSPRILFYVLNSLVYRWQIHSAHLWHIVCSKPR
jgi:hypothetical protein